MSDKASSLHRITLTCEKCFVSNSTQQHKKRLWGGGRCALAARINAKSSDSNAPDHATNKNQRAHRLGE
ncbi:hypothetical protein RESH_02439 [Rhodopirellula europaea SH398]|uniref:Uncharacterized protein n=1 Tax=Rhodopirellula europaea SH398 TaxID=1263868 RepID=M5S5T9_9BACT|nr:hypothetical protein RESH_02439 [Rhodopirellula europaea SH398]